MNCIPGSVGPIDPNFELETCWDNPALIGTVGGGICIPGNFQIEFNEKILFQLLN